MEANERLQGLVFDIHRATTHDGPGMRTTAFFKGCPLRCEWCQNPESISKKFMPVWDRKTCIACKLCVAACKHGALTVTKEGVVIERKRCQSCSLCTEACPSGAMKQTGRQYSVTGLADELVKDRMFFDEFDGGVTVSGGEPALQPDFLAALLKELKSRGVHTAVDTTGFCETDTLRRLLLVTDVFLYDIKVIDAKLHFRFTGADNARILENFRFLCEAIRAGETDARLWVRTPLIPGTTATEGTIRAIGAFLNLFADAVDRWELCAFNNACRDKYRQLGIAWKYADTPLMRQADVDALAKVAGSIFVQDKIVVSGMIAKD